MKSLKVLGSVLVFAAALGCEREIEREEGVVSGITREEGAFRREYCAGLSEGGILNDERGSYDRCRSEGLLDD